MTKLNEMNVNEIETMIIEMKAYSLGHNLSQDDNDLMNEFTNEYSGSTYICDAISEIADSNISVYNSTVCDETWNLYSSGAYEEASCQGLMEGSDDLIKNLQMAWYEYNSQQLNDNIDELIYNYAVEYMNNNNIELTEEEFEEFESEIDDIDSDNTFDDIEDIVNSIIENRE